MHLRIILRFGFTLVPVVIMLYAYKILICIGTTRFLKQKKVFLLEISQLKNQKRYFILVCSIVKPGANTIRPQPVK